MRREYLQERLSPHVTAQKPVKTTCKTRTGTLEEVINKNEQVDDKTAIQIYMEWSLRLQM